MRTSSDDVFRADICFVIYYLGTVLGQRAQEFSVPLLVSELHPRNHVVFVVIAEKQAGFDLGAGHNHISVSRAASE